MKTKNVTVLLGGHLRDEVGEGRGELEVPLPEPPTIGRLLEEVGLRPERVKLILLNGKGATMLSPLEGGDRVGLFPPELSFNTFVSLSFREERVRGRIGEFKGGGWGSAQD